MISLKVRKCYCCGDLLTYDNYMKVQGAITIKQAEFLKKVWDSEHIALFCCSCYSIAKRFGTCI